MTLIGVPLVTLIGLPLETLIGVTVGPSWTNLDWTVHQDGLETLSGAGMTISKMPLIAEIHV
jgi:hypothetical protein